MCGRDDDDDACEIEDLLYVRAKDRFGNHVTSGGDAFTVLLTGGLLQLEAVGA